MLLGNRGCTLSWDTLYYYQLDLPDAQKPKSFLDSTPSGDFKIECPWMPSRRSLVTTFVESRCRYAVEGTQQQRFSYPVSYTHLRAHETRHDLVCRLLLEKK